MKVYTSPIVVAWIVMLSHHRVASSVAVAATTPFPPSSLRGSPQPQRAANSREISPCAVTLARAQSPPASLEYYVDLWQSTVSAIRRRLSFGTKPRIVSESRSDKECRKKAAKTNTDGSAPIFIFPSSSSNGKAQEYLKQKENPAATDKTSVPSSNRQSERSKRLIKK